MEKNIIAVFDFDKTITVKDSFIDLIWYTFGYRCIPKFIILAPIFFMFVSKLLTRKRAKEIMFELFFKGIKESKFIELCRKYSLNQIDNIARKEAIDKINWHKNKGHHLVILSASIYEWIKPWAEKNGFEKVITTNYEVVNGIVTGNFSSENCHGPEKLNRFKNEYGEVSELYIFMYGDSRGDREMLEIANEKFYRKF